MSGWIKLHRSESAEHLHSNPMANHLLSIIAFRARRTDHPINGLKSGQCFLGDYTNYGMTRAQYRHALSNLHAWSYVTIKSTNKGTIVTLLNTDTYDINEEANNQPITIQQPTEHHPTTTNKECKKERMEELNHMFDLFWNAGMRKTGKKIAQKKFMSLASKKNGSLESWTNNLVVDIRDRLASGQLGFDQMHPSTYLNGERWEDELINENNKDQTQDYLI